MIKLFFVISLFFIFSCNGKNNPEIVIKTNLGNITAELFADKAPVSVKAFLSYVDSGLYKNSSFYRVVAEESMVSNDITGLIQGGLWQANNKKAQELQGIAHEPTAKTGLSHTSGTLSLARTTAGTANSEFFICIGNQLAYDNNNNDGLGYAAFGKVIGGMAIVRAIQKQPSNGAAFTRPVQILSIERQ
jgi:peptidyl-prolyl cis-trans isomerase A (cyclophilin A)